MRTILSWALAIVLLLLYGNANSQLSEAWARTGGGTGNDLGISVATNHHGGVFIAGSFSSSTFNIGNTALTNAGGTDIFVAKYDTAGNFLWAQRFGGNGNETVNRLTLSNDGSIYFTDTFTTVIHLGSYTFTPSGSANVYVAKLDSNGILQWAKQLIGLNPDVTTDSRGFVYLGYEIATTGANGDCSLIKYTGNGSVIFSKTITSGHYFGSIFPTLSIDRFDNIHVCFYHNNTFQTRNWYDSTGNSLGSQPITGETRFFIRGYRAKYPNEYYYSGEFIPLSGVNSLRCGGNSSPIEYYYGCNKTIVNTDIDGQGNQFTSGYIHNETGQFCNGLYTLSAGSLNIQGSTGYDIFFSQQKNSQGIIYLSSTKGNGNTDEFPKRIVADTNGHAIYVIGYWSKITDTSKFRFGNSVLVNNGNINTKDFLLLKLYFQPGILTINAGPDKTICYGGSVTIGNSASGGTASYTYSWSPATGLSNATIATPVASPAITTNYILTVTDAAGSIARDTVKVIVDSNLYRPSISILTGTNPFCEGQSVAIASSAASSYHWSNNATTQSIVVSHADTLTVTAVRNDGCIGTSLPFIAIMKPRTATPTIAASGPLCSGSSITLTAQDSETPVNYNWNTGATTSTIIVSASGTYSVNAIGANECPSLPASVSIVSNPVPTVNTVLNRTHCNGDAATEINFNGSVPLTTFNWVSSANIGFGISGSGNISPYTASNQTNSSLIATVTVTPTANGCTGSSMNFTITVNPTPTGIIIPNGNTSFCDGDSLRLSINTAAGNFWQWNTGLVLQNIWVKTSGVYFAQIQSPQGCTSTSNTINVRVFSLPSIRLSQSGNVLTAAPAVSSYQWYLNGSLMTGTTAPSITITKGGNYSVIGTDSNGSKNSDSKSAILRIVNPMLTYQVYPNPVFNDLCILYTLTEKKTVGVTILDFKGQQVYSLFHDQLQNAGEYQYKIDNLSQKLMHGIYFVCFNINGKKILKKMLIM